MHITIILFKHTHIFSVLKYGLNKFIHVVIITYECRVGIEEYINVDLVL